MSAVADLQQDLTDLKAAVATVGTSLDTLAKKLADAIAANDPAALAAIHTGMRAQIDALNAAVAKDNPPAV